MLVIDDAGQGHGRSRRIRRPSPCWRSTTATRSSTCAPRWTRVSQLPASAIKSYAWDSATQQLIESGRECRRRPRLGNVPSATLAKVLGIETLRAGDRRPGRDRTISPVLVVGRAAAVEAGEDPRAGALPGQRAREDRRDDHGSPGVGDRFNGNVFVSGVHHSIRDGNWFTTVDFGLPAGWQRLSAPVGVRPGRRAPAADPRTPDRRRQAGRRRPGRRVPRPRRRCRSCRATRTACGRASRPSTRRMRSAPSSTRRSATR